MANQRIGKSFRYITRFTSQRRLLILPDTQKKENTDAMHVTNRDEEMDKGQKR